MAGIVAMLFGAGINAMRLPLVGLIICLASYQITVLMKGRDTTKQ